VYDISLPLSPATQAYCLGWFDFPRLAEPRQGLGFYRLLRRLVEWEAQVSEFLELLKNLQRAVSVSLVAMCLSGILLTGTFQLLSRVLTAL
jgi:hypothetical protein